MKLATRLVGAGAACAAFAIAFMIGRELSLRNDRRQADSPLQRWEDEGGNVPDVPTPDPRTPPSTGAY